MLTDLLLVPVAISLYAVLRQADQPAMLIASAFTLIVVVLDLAVTWPAYASLVVLGGQYATAAGGDERAGGYKGWLCQAVRVTAGILGLRRQLTAYPQPVPGGRLIENGAFGLVRHPMYGGGVLAALGWGLAMASPMTLVGAAVLGLFADLKSRREETWLGEQFADYAAYRRRTHRLIPWLY